MTKAAAFLAFCLCCLSALFPGAALAAVEGKGVALVIGNSEYKNAVSLPNPARDATLMAATLRGAGFDVVEGINLDKPGMQAAIDQFTEKAYDADVALIFYAGHGMQADNKNYLIPVDANLSSPAHLKTRTIEIDKFLAALPTGDSVGIVILDACRDNLMARTLAASLPASRSTMTFNRGLARVDAPSAGTGTGGILIAYSTDPGEVALDGKGENSPYTASLAKYLTIPGLAIQSALIRVRGEVVTETEGRQRPWTSVSLGREVFLGGETPVQQAALPAAIQPAAPVVSDAAPTAVSVVRSADEEQVENWEVERRLWDEATKRNSIPHFEAYLAQYPDGKFASIASLNIDQLKSQQQVASAEPVPEIEKAGSMPRTAVAMPDELKTIGGTAISEAAIGLNRDRKLDLQLRLQSLGLNVGVPDGSFGRRSRAAIGEWQGRNGMIQSSFLTQAQYDFLLVQTEPMIAAVRAQFEQQGQSVTPRRSVTRSQSVARNEGAPSRQKVRSARKPAKGGSRYVVRRVPQRGGGNDFATGLAVGAGIGILGGMIGR